VWACGRVGVWACVCVGVWVCGCVGVGVWVCGCVGVGVLVCGCSSVWCGGVGVGGWVEVHTYRARNDMADLKQGLPLPVRQTTATGRTPPDCLRRVWPPTRRIADCIQLGMACRGACIRAHLTCMTGVGSGRGCRAIMPGHAHRSCESRAAEPRCGL